MRKMIAYCIATLLVLTGCCGCNKKKWKCDEASKEKIFYDRCMNYASDFKATTFMEAHAECMRQTKAQTHCPEEDTKSEY